ncbi:MAG: MFS transporter [Gammaproteobacteria bacterium RIFCSPHIGHO2_12_FULL_35_23]|nr:MAG: MFS transporter [Gammaproteobacteria bacterium RIFCSPHIGHO2_12_FULL_35_23]
MTRTEQIITLSLASIYAFRMLGLFMILPVFAVYASTLQLATPFLVGQALGIYGLTQALLQIPFGMSSDHLGRKPVIFFGLILFALGSILAALSHSIEGIIIGRALQGAGAIGSTITALLADLIPDEERLKAMSVIGMTIGLSFIIAMILGPLLTGMIGVPGIFWLTAVLALLGMIILSTLVPTPKRLLLHRDTEPVLNQFTKILTNLELLRLDAGILILHASLTAMFIVIPSILLQNNIPLAKQWVIYLPVLILAFMCMMPFIIIAEKKRCLKETFIGAIIILIITQGLLWLFHFNVVMIAIILIFFFAAFTFLEASLPSLIAKISPAGNKGTAMGVYSSSQFLGIFIGGVVGGSIVHYFNFKQVFMFGTLLGISWLLFAITMKSPRYLSSKVITIGLLKDRESAKVLQTKLLTIKGIIDVLVCPDEGVAYLKIDNTLFANNDLINFLKSQGETYGKR